MEALIPSKVPVAPEAIEALPELEQDTADKKAEALLQWYAQNLDRFMPWILTLENTKVHGEMQRAMLERAVTTLKHPTTGETSLSKADVERFDERVVAINNLYKLALTLFVIVDEATGHFNDLKKEIQVIRDGHKKIPREEGPCTEEKAVELAMKIDTALLILAQFAERNKDGWFGKSRAGKAEAALLTWQQLVDSYVDPTREKGGLREAVPQKKK